ncbi:hypothetical protein JB92DRAFT_3117432 [Gautieria morchelliformis]|nr:hypothetical protein JB92DRAFT_3117432 [Gautieria morchelliformis]
MPRSGVTELVRIHDGAAGGTVGDTEVLTHEEGWPSVDWPTFGAVVPPHKPPPCLIAAAAADLQDFRRCYLPYQTLLTAAIGSAADQVAKGATTLLPAPNPVEGCCVLGC